MGTKKQKLQITVVEIPTSIEEVDKSITKIALTQNEIDKIAQGYEKKILALQNEAKEKVSPLAKEVETTFAGIYAYCEANRPTLLPKGRKTIDLPSGVICWRFNPPSVVTKSKMKVEEIIKLLRKKGLGKFIRPKYEINKEAILASPDSIIGIPEIKIVQEETFNVKPNDLLKELTEKSETLQKLLPKKG